MLELDCPSSIKIAIQLIVVNTLFAVFLFFGQIENMNEPFGSLSVPFLSLILCIVWFSLAWFIYKQFSWARTSVVILLILSIAYTAVSVISNPATVMPVEFLQTASDLVVLFLLSSPSSLEWVKNDS